MPLDHSFTTALLSKWARKWEIRTLGILGQPWFGYLNLKGMNHMEIIRGSLSELYDCISVGRDESKYISFNISCLNNVDISTFEAMQFLNRYFFFIIEYLLLRPNLKIHADGFRIKKQSILDHQIIFNSPCWA